MPRNVLPAWFMRFLKRYKRSVAVAAVLGLAASGCAALLMFASGYLISATAVPGMTLFAVMVPVACVQLFGLGRPLARYLERLVSHDWVLRLTSDMRLMLYRGIRSRIGDPERERAAGEYLGLLSDDLAHLQNLYLRVVFPTGVAFLLILAASAVFGAFSVPFCLFMLLVFAFTAVALPAMSLLANKALAERAKDLRSSGFARMTDDVMGSLDWVLARREADALDAIARADDEVRVLRARSRMLERTISLASTLVLGATVCLITAWSAARFGGNALEANWIAAFVLGFFPLIESIAVLPAALAQVPDHAIAIDRLEEYVADGPAESDSAPDTAANTEEAEAKSGSLAIRMDDVAYRYPQAENDALRGLSLHIPAGQSIAILGRSGSGKSTLAQLVRGILAPDRGSVEVLGRRPGAYDMPVVGYLGQSPYLFNRTLRDNLTLGVTLASDEKLEGVLASVGLKEALTRLPQGLDTIVGETGIGFSGGEAHRVALARVIAADTPIVLVDEPFSALDPHTESELLDTLLEVCADKTLVVVTHHLAQVERFDRVVFVEDGAIDLDGSPEALLHESPRFKKLLAFDRNCP